ncbi:MAG: hypothetical protein H6737_26435 [Alphaproteobacteria bacterium]|nr:hypothetical protein [Alphaproteobacteria bacterium]
MRAVMLLGLVGLLAGSATASAAEVTITEARVWLSNDMESMKRIGTQPRVSATITDGKVGPAACEAVSKGTKWGRVVWGMKGKAHEFELRAPVKVEDGKMTIAGKIAVDASGGQKVVTCELVEYDAAKDDPPEWPTQQY